jgi:site-specific recombinase XerD
MESDNKTAEAISNGLLPEQAKVVNEYYKECTLSGLADSTCDNKLKEITLFAKSIKKPFDEVTKEDIKDYILKLREHLKENTLAVRKSQIKCFFKWLYKSDDYPDIVRWIRTGYAKSKHRLPESILTPDDVKVLIDTAKTVQHKAMVSVLYDTAVRLGEFLGMNLNEIQYDDNGAFTFVNGKTGQRIVRFIHSMHYLSNWLEHHPYKAESKRNKNKTYPLWVSHSTWKKGQRLTETGVSGILREIAENTQINKKITPHQFRHARLTDLARKGINEPSLKKIAGWVGNSTMPETYIHLSGRDGVNQLLEVEKHGYIKPEAVENPLKPVNCPRCGQENGSALNYCGLCGMPLDEKELIVNNSLNSILNDPLKILIGLKEAYSNYEALVENIYTVLNLKTVIEKHKRITRANFQEKLGITENFDGYLNSLQSQNLIEIRGNIISFPEGSKEMVENYCKFFKNFKEET